jgi:PLP dependent protein
MDQAALTRRIAENLAGVQARIDDAAQGREVTLCCVTKYAQTPWVEALLEAGASHLAENLLPNACERFTALRDGGYSFTRHLIGAQQSRKLKLVPGQFDVFQAVDRLKTAELLQQELVAQGAGLDVLIEVNIAREAQKHGVLESELPELLEMIETRGQAMRLRGLMAVPPWPQAYPSAAEYEQGTRRCFQELKRLFDTIGGKLRSAALWDSLSMGMSQDFTWAIAEGATIVRVGSALFEGLEG